MNAKHKNENERELCVRREGKLEIVRFGTTEIALSMLLRLMMPLDIISFVILQFCFSYSSSFARTTTIFNDSFIHSLDSNFIRLSFIRLLSCHSLSLTSPDWRSIAPKIHSHFVWGHKNKFFLYFGKFVGWAFIFINIFNQTLIEENALNRFPFSGGFSTPLTSMSSPEIRNEFFVIIYCFLFY